MTVIASKDNPKARHWKKLAEDSRYRRLQRRALIEGPHLVAAALEQRCRLLALFATEKGAATPENDRLIRRSGLPAVMMGERLFAAVVDADTPQGIAAEIAIPDAPKNEAARAVFLEGVQDPSNVGAIIRSAAAFGVERIVLDRQCADAWSPRALRAGMGGHFRLAMESASDLGEEIRAFTGTIAATVVRGGTALRDARFNGALAWVFGAEGQGISDKTLKRASLRVTIPIAAGSESLNVAAAAAICLYETFGKGS